MINNDINVFVVLGFFLLNVCYCSSYVFIFCQLFWWTTWFRKSIASEKKKSISSIKRIISWIKSTVTHNELASCVCWDSLSKCIDIHKAPRYIYMACHWCVPVRGSKDIIQIQYFHQIADGFKLTCNVMQCRKDLPQNLQIYGQTFVWLLKWTVNVFFRRNLAPHIEHSWGL